MPGHLSRPADPLFADARLAGIADAVDPDRSDLDVYDALVARLGARRVLDVGCGTGTFALMLAARGLDVVGLDPAAASVDVARAKPGAERVEWLVGGADAAGDLVGEPADTATMTANVAQVFTTDDDWSAALAGVHAALRPGGHLVLESRVPVARAWERWTPEHTRARVDVPGVGAVEGWCELTGVDGPLVSFRWTYVFEADGAVLTSDSTLRFRTLDELESSLGAAGFEVAEVLDSPDRPGLEHVLVARFA